MMRAWITSPVLIVFSSLLLAALALWWGARIMIERAPVLEAVAFSGIEGWESDDHGQAFAAFQRSCARIVQVADARAKSAKGESDFHPLTDICKAALGLGEKIERDAAREFFETRFTPHRYSGENPSGFVTGYYEPELHGARARTKRFSVPVYRVPDDLTRLAAESERAARNHEMTYARKTPQGLVPYYERKDIEQGALEGRNLEILYLEN